MLFKLLYAVVIASQLISINGFQRYVRSIPNGAKVPNPCSSGSLVAAIGHLNPAGGGFRNNFGEDFKRENYLWTNVCNLDSDGDGMTNGQELGDPFCIWREGTADPPAPDGGITHPAICTPLDLDICVEFDPCGLKTTTINDCGTKQLKIIIAGIVIVCLSWAIKIPLMIRKYSNKGLETPPMENRNVSNIYEEETPPKYEDIVLKNTQISNKQFSQNE